MRTRRRTVVVRSNAAVSLDASFAERTVVLVRSPVLKFSHFPTIICTDLGDFLQSEIKGPASFTCKSGGGCKFEEPAMNVLITQVFGDSSITLECEGGECLHYSQVPGYVASVLHFSGMVFI